MSTDSVVRERLEARPKPRLKIDLYHSSCSEKSWFSAMILERGMTLREQDSKNTDASYLGATEVTP